VSALVGPIAPIAKIIATPTLQFNLGSATLTIANLTPASTATIIVNQALLMWPTILGLAWLPIAAPTTTQVFVSAAFPPTY